MDMNRFSYIYIYIYAQRRLKERLKRNTDFHTHQPKHTHTHTHTHIHTHTHTYIYIYIYISLTTSDDWSFHSYHHHHHVTLVARISLTLPSHSSLSFIGPGKSSGQHPVSSHSCWMYVRAGRPAVTRPCVGVHKSTSLMSSSLLSSNFIVIRNLN